MDKATLDIISLLLGTSGLFSVLTKFYVPELNKAYFGVNPHAVKRDAIDGATTPLFLALGLLGAGIQAVALVIGDENWPRVHPQSWYTLVLVIGAAVTALLMSGMSALGRRLARQRWMSALGTTYAENLDYLHFMLNGDASFSEAYRKKKKLEGEAQIESMRKANTRSAQDMIVDLERLFEITSTGSDWRARLERVSGYIEPHYRKKELDRGVQQ